METIMREKFSASMITVAITGGAVSTVISVSITRSGAQAPATSTTLPVQALKTPWGEPDLQGIWTVETDTPFQRLPKYADQEFFTEAQRAELDRARSEVLGRDQRAERGTERDVSGSYNSVFVVMKRVGARTSLIVDPPNGRMPPLTPAAQKTAAAEREFRLALLQSTETCKDKEAACSGGKYDPTRSPRFADLPPRYNVARWTRTGPATLEYVVIIEDPSVWTKSWTVKQEFTTQSNQENRFYSEPRCIEGNYGLPGIIHGRRTEERAFAEGRGPDPATRDSMKGGFIFDDDPLR